MLLHHSMWSADCDDATLVSASLNGDREAFGQIVSRYQALVASVAYSATGSLAQSEDLAQETFVAAWKQLKSLREPGKLRAWLYGIARHAAANFLRRQQREPVQKAMSLEFAVDTPTPEALPVEHAITREEESILWRSLEQIPETYREPLILFYRENQAIECVAASLGLSEDAVRQRLSRGRKLLEERVAVFVEGALRKSSPGRSFTLGVLSVLPAQMASLGSASATLAAAKGGAVTKAATWLALFNSCAGIFSGGVAGVLGYDTDMAGASTDQERKHVRRFYGLMAGCVAVSVSLVLVTVWAKSLAQTHPGLFAALAIGTGLSWVPPAALLALRLQRSIVARDSDESSLRTEPPAVYEYRSRISLFGLPLVHVRFGGTCATRHTPIKAWVAIGDVAIGALFAAGRIAMAPVALGGFAVGGILFAGFGAGIVAYAGFALGVWVMGGIVVGFEAVGGCAIAWKAALGGIAVAGQMALGGVAVALHANDAIAKSFINNHAFFQYAYLLLTKWLWPTNLLVATLAFGMWHIERRKRRLS